MNEALELRTPHLERLLGRHQKSALWTNVKHERNHRRKGMAIDPSKAVLYTVAVLDLLGVFVEVDEQFFEKMEISVVVQKRTGQAITAEDIGRVSGLGIDVNGQAQAWIAATLCVWDDLLEALETLRSAELVKTSVSVELLGSTELRRALARFVEALATRRSEAAQAAARSQSTTIRLGPGSPSGERRTGEAGEENHPATFRVPRHHSSSRGHEATAPYRPLHELRACLDEVMKCAGIVNGVNPMLAAERVQRAIETEVLRGIVESRLVSTHEVDEIEHKVNLARYATLPLFSCSSPTQPPAEVNALPLTTVVIPVSLVSTYVLLEFARTHWRVPLVVSLLDTASAVPLFAYLELQAPELAVVPRASLELLHARSGGSGYVPLTTLGRGSHGMVVSAASSSNIHELGAMNMDMLCIGQRTPQRFLGDLVRLRLLDQRKLSISSADPGTGVMMRASAEALSENVAVVAFFPIDVVMEAVGIGRVVPLDRLQESTSSHVLLGRVDRVADARWTELVVRVLHSARECLASEPRYFRATVEDVLTSKPFVDAFIKCLKR